jgi:hypothetical protein
MAFFSAAFILGIVAMATYQVRRGLVLFCCSLAAIVLIPLSFMILGVGIFGLAVAKAQQHMEASGPVIRPLQAPPKLFLPQFSPPPAQRSYIAPRQSQPVRDYSTSAVESFIRQARVSGIMSGNPSIAVINGKDYEVGQEVIIPSGARLRVTAIAQNSVYLRWQNRDFTIALR